MNDERLVSVICLCYNHEAYVGDAIQSVLDQTHSNTELIVVDDASEDDSVSKILSFKQNVDFQFIQLNENLGNCKAFNLALKKAKGEFIIDLAADDILLSDRISKGLTQFDDNDIGVNFCDVVHQDAEGNDLGTQYLRDENGDIMQDIPQGDVYRPLIERYFISPPGLMIRKKVLNELEGYDESLAYEDFDFCIRSARNWMYSFEQEPLVIKRDLANSHGKNQFKPFSSQQKSTLKICKKIKMLNRSNEEKRALRRRCLYEIRLCIKQGNVGLIPGYLKLLLG